MIAANWKMHKTIAETEAFLIEFKKFAGRFSGVEVLICPPY
ncbi:MAG: triose-phosphate isomerase, partial [Dethiobacter sp.]|nr:triose-phosphate isomerase [Dethiobacter sp.]